MAEQLTAYEANLRANPRLSRFNPLERIIFHDDFDYGLGGWLEVIGNFERDVDNVTYYPDLMDSRPPMLSTATMHDTGSQGAFEGMYSMKVATRPIHDHVAKALKRITYFKQTKVRCEAIFTFKPEDSDQLLGADDVRAVGISYDLQDDEERFWPAIRFLNAEGGERVEKWQYHVGGTRLPHLDGWEDVPDGHQELCYNETGTKQNWHYVSWTIDLRDRQYVDLRCNDRNWDLSGRRHNGLELYPNLRTLMNLGFFVETATDKRAFMYVDSVLLSAEG